MDTTKVIKGREGRKEGHSELEDADPCHEVDLSRVAIADPPVASLSEAGRLDVKQGALTWLRGASAPMQQYSWW